MKTLCSLECLRQRTSPWKMIKTHADAKVMRVTDHLIKKEQEAAWDSKDIFSSFFSFESNFFVCVQLHEGNGHTSDFWGTALRGARQPWSKKNTFTSACMHTNTSTQTWMENRWNFFKKPSLIRVMFASSLLQDEQSDSGMVLPSEELNHLTWNNGTKNRKLSRW